MDTRGDVFGMVAGLAGDPYRDWITPEYFSSFCNTAYEAAIVYLQGTCSTNIEKTVMVSGVSVSGDENDLTPSSQGAVKTDPLACLIEPRFIDFKPTGTANSQYKPACECTILPDTPIQVTSGLFDFRVRGDFRPAKLLTDDVVVEIHPMAGHALACSIMALIGMERPNQGWVDNYGKQAQDAWDQIASELIRSQQRKTYRLGSPNRANNQRSMGWNYNLQGNIGWEWRGFRIYVKLI